MLSKSKNKAAPRAGTSEEKEASNRRIANLVDKALKGMEARLAIEKEPLGIADYIRLMQLQKEIEEEQPREIKVTWVDPEPKKQT